MKRLFTLHLRRCFVAPAIAFALTLSCLPAQPAGAQSVPNSNFTSPSSTPLSCTGLTQATTGSFIFTGSTGAIDVLGLYKGNWYPITVTDGSGNQYTNAFTPASNTLYTLPNTGYSSIEVAPDASFVGDMTGSISCIGSALPLNINIGSAPPVTLSYNTASPLPVNCISGCSGGGGGGGGSSTFPPLEQSTTSPLPVISSLPVIGQSYFWNGTGWVAVTASSPFPVTTPVGCASNFSGVCLVQPTAVPTIPITCAAAAYPCGFPTPPPSVIVVCAAAVNCLNAPTPIPYTVPTDGAGKVVVETAAPVTSVSASIGPVVVSGTVSVQATCPASSYPCGAPTPLATVYVSNAASFPTTMPVPTDANGKVIVETAAPVTSVSASIGPITFSGTQPISVVLGSTPIPVLTPAPNATVYVANVSSIPTTAPAPTGTNGSVAIENRILTFADSFTANGFGPVHYLSGQNTCQGVLSGTAVTATYSLIDDLSAASLASSSYSGTSFVLAATPLVGPNASAIYAVQSHVTGYIGSGTLTATWYCSLANSNQVTVINTPGVTIQNTPAVTVSGPVTIATPTYNVQDFQGTSPWVVTTPTATAWPTGNGGGNPPNAPAEISYGTCYYNTSSMLLIASNSIAVQCNAHGSLMVTTPAPAPTASTAAAGALAVGVCTSAALCAPPIGDTGFNRVVTTTLTQVIAAPASGNIRITAISADGFDSATGGVIELEYGTGTNCGTGTTILHYLYVMPASLSLSPGFSAGTGVGAVIIVPAGNAFCVQGAGTIVDASIVGTYTVY